MSVQTIVKPKMIEMSDANGITINTYEIVRKSELKPYVSHCRKALAAIGCATALGSAIKKEPLVKKLPGLPVILGALTALSFVNTKNTIVADKPVQISLTDTYLRIFEPYALNINGKNYQKSTKIQFNSLEQLRIVEETSELFIYGTTEISWFDQAGIWCPNPSPSPTDFLNESFIALKCPADDLAAIVDEILARKTVALSVK